jgi:predicted DNA-binding protein (UPF0251 family)
MGRPKNCRRVSFLPDSKYFKPRGIPLDLLEEIILTVDECEAIRLADFEGLYQEQAAEKMAVSRQTFGRIIESAHKKVAEALVKGKALRIEGGEIEVSEMRNFKCSDCRYAWELPYGTGRPLGCPSCKSANIHRAVEDRGTANRLQREQGRCCRGPQQEK